MKMACKRLFPEFVLILWEKMVECVDFWNFSLYIGFLGGALIESGLTIASDFGYGVI